ncbi:MAG: hypothetical protein R6U56_09080 [Opitutales bacterium]
MEGSLLDGLLGGYFTGEAFDHFEDPAGAFGQVGVDGVERTRWLEDVEVTVEGDFVADLGLALVDPGVGV